MGSLATRFPKDTLLHLKPLLGKSLDDEDVVLTYLKEHPGLNITTTERNTLAFNIEGTEYPIEEVIAMNLQEIVCRGNGMLNEKDARTVDYVDKMAITVPDFFDQHQRKALENVGDLVSGVQGTVLVNGGISIAIDYALKQRDLEFDVPQYNIIYDMGSGSTEASLFSFVRSSNESEPLKIELGGYGYTAKIGGSSFNMAVASLIENKFLSKHPKIRTDELHANAKAIAKINQIAEKTKLILSANNDASVTIESLIDDIDFKTSVSRQELEDYMQDHVTQFIEPIQEALDEQFWEDGSHIDLKDVASIILHGGSTRVPLVQQELIKFLGEVKIAKNINADEASVNGAVLRGIKLFDAFKTKPLNIIERSISNYGIKISSDGDRKTIFSKGDVYPQIKTIEFNSTTVEQPFSIDLYENDLLFGNASIATESIEKQYTSKKCQFGVVYNATFSLSVNRVFALDKIEAVCVKQLGDEEEAEGLMGKLFGSKKNGTKQGSDDKPKVLKNYNPTTNLPITYQDVGITHLNGTEKYQIRKFIRDLEEKDQQRFDLQESKNLLESSLYSARNFLDEDEVISNGPKAQVEKLVALVSKYLEWLEEDSDHAVKTAVEEMTREIDDLKNKIEMYLKTSKEPLDEEQFEELMEKASSIYNATLIQYKTVEENLKNLEAIIPPEMFDVREAYVNVTLPTSCLLYTSRCV